MAIPFDPQVLSSKLAGLGLTTEDFKKILSGERSWESFQPSSESKDDSTVSQILRQAEIVKANFEKEQDLPPAKAPHQDRGMFIRQFVYQRESSKKQEKELQGDVVTMKMTYVGMARNSCQTPLEELRPIKLRQMFVRKVHEGRYLLCRVVTPGFRLTAVQLAVEDVSGDVANLSIYHLPALTASPIADVDPVFPVGTILAVREPYYKIGAGGGISSIRVDAPSDIVMLEPGHPLLSGVSWSHGPPSHSLSLSSSSTEQWRARGVADFKSQRWLSAALHFSRGLSADPSAHVLRLNRSETYIRLGWFNSALGDAEHVIKEGKSLEATLRNKAIFRAVKALYNLSHYDALLNFAKAHGESGEIEDFVSRATERLQEQRTGQYDWFKLFKNSQGPCPRLDVADYVGPVVVRDTGTARGRGVFVTRDVKCGEILMACKPLASSYPEEIPDSDNTWVFDLMRNRISKSTQCLLVNTLTQRLWDDPTLAATLKTLYAGPKHAAPLPYPPEAVAAKPLEHPFHCNVSIDMARLEAITSFNDFGITPEKPHTLDASSAVNSESEKFESPTALYALPSLCNHSCISSATYSMFGDFMVIRALRNMKKDEEVTLQYVSGACAQHLRADKLKQWDITCSCALCRADKKDGAQACQRREEIHQRVTEDSLNHNYVAQQNAISAAKQQLKALQGTYADTPLRRACALKPALVPAHQLLAKTLTAKATKASTYARMSSEEELKALDMAGIDVVDRSWSGPQRLRDGLPISKDKLPVFYQFESVAAMLHQSARCNSVDDESRADAWLRAAMWTENQLLGGGPDLFRLRFKQFIEVWQLEDVLQRCLQRRL